MSRRREVIARHRALTDIRGILASMKTLALIETHKLARSLEAQQGVVNNMAAAAADFEHFYHLSPEDGGTVGRMVLLVGAERGFCGEFNTRLMRRMDEPGTGNVLYVAVGHRLSLKLENDPRVVLRLDGAGSTEEADGVLARVLDAIGVLREQRGNFALGVLYHAEAGAPPVLRQVLPPFGQLAPPARRHSHPPRLNLRPARFFAELADHYLFAQLHEVFFASLMAENQQRVRHLEGAVSRLDERIGHMTLRANALRQEEITEEIEIILLSAEEWKTPAGVPRGPRGDEGSPRLRGERVG